MTTRLVVFALASLVPAAAAAQHFHHHVAAAPEDDKRTSVCKKIYAPPDLDATLPPVPWQVVTNVPSARDHFQQGMALYYGFDYEGALSHFKAATKLDETFLMGWWGRALAAGPNINFLDIDDDCRFAAQAWADRAWSLAQKRSPQHVEYQLAKAILLRYSDDKKILTDEYAAAMGDIWKIVDQAAYADVGALYAESLMDKYPWDLWTRDTPPKEKYPDTHTVLTVLRAVIAKHPEAVGANHYFIHAVEAGPKPEEAKPSADFLKKKAGNAGHLRHMPSHTYLLMGDYAGAVDANERATFVDRELFEGPCKGDYKDYVDSPKCRQVYYGHYHAHDLFFRSVAESFLGKIGASRQHANEARTHVQRFVVNEPGLQRYMAAPYQVMAAWGIWDAILDGETEPSTDCYKQAPFTQPTGCRILRSMYHWARGMAYTSSTAKRRADVKAAKDELALFVIESDLIKPPDSPLGWGNNKAADVLVLAAETLQARIAWAERRYDDAIRHLETAVAKEDTLVYDEPPQWLFPVRQSLGGAYLARGRYQDAAKAFEQDLVPHPNNGRSLYGAYLAYEKSDPVTAAKYKALYEDAWEDADGFVKPLYPEALWLLGLLAPPRAEGSPASGR